MESHRTEIEMVASEFKELVFKAIWGKERLSDCIQRMFNTKMV